MEKDHPAISKEVSFTGNIGQLALKGGTE